MNDLRRELRETRHGAPHMRVEVSLRASPKGAEKAVLTVVRDEERLRFDTPETTCQLGHRWKARYVKVNNFGHVSGRQPEGIAICWVPCEQDDTVPCDTT